MLKIVRSSSYAGEVASRMSSLTAKATMTTRVTWKIQAATNDSSVAVGEVAVIAEVVKSRINSGGLVVVVVVVSHSVMFIGGCIFL